MATKQAAAGATVAKKGRILTEEDLLKAPEKDYMNDEQLAFFRQRLVDIRDQILRNADNTGEHLRENEVTTDPSDRNPFARGAGAPRARAEDVRRLNSRPPRGRESATAYDPSAEERMPWPSQIQPVGRPSKPSPRRLR